MRRVSGAGYKHGTADAAHKRAANPINRGLGFASTHGYEHDARDRAFTVASGTHKGRPYIHNNHPRTFTSYCF